MAGKLQHAAQAPVAQQGQNLVAQAPGNAGQRLAATRFRAVSWFRPPYWQGSSPLWSSR
jgi:hypothetical protein